MKASLTLAQLKAAIDAEVAAGNGDAVVSVSVFSKLPTSESVAVTALDGVEGCRDGFFTLVAEVGYPEE